MALKISDGKDIEELERALYDAFPDDDSFAKMLAFGFGEEAVRIGGVKYVERAHELIKWTGARSCHDHLVRVARRANIDNSRLRDFEKKTIGTSIPTERLQELEEILVTEKLDLKGVRTAASAFDDLPSIPADTHVRTAFRRIVDHLASTGLQSDGTLPLSTFARELAARVGRGGKVKEWAKKLPNRGTQAPPRRTASSLYLFVKCDTEYRKSVSETDEIQVEMWLWRLDDQGVAIDEIPDRVCPRRTMPLGELPKLISELHRGPLSARLAEAQDRIVVAFCLSQAALAHAVERWKIVVGETVREIGQTYPVVIRSFERLYHRPGTWGRWNRQWQQIVNRRPKGPGIRWFGGEISVQEFTDQVHAQDMTCAALTHPSAEELVARTIDAGIPAVIWSRSSSSCSSDEMNTFLRKLLSGRLVGLPDRLYNARRRGKPAPVESVALLWDPYDRLPPDADEGSPLAAPDR